jgi:hypothetical protein
LLRFAVDSGEFPASLWTTWERWGGAQGDVWQGGGHVRSAAVVVAPSALKHGVGAADAVQAVYGALVAARLRGNPDKILYLGFDTAGRLLEIIVVVREDGSAVLIHAMPCRKTYRKRYLRN